MLYESSELDKIRDSAQTIFKAYGVDLKIRGNSAVGLCPFHEDTNPSFNVRISGDKRGQWICQACNQKGPDVFSFIADKEGLDRRRDFPKVVQKAAEILNFSIEATKENDGERPKRLKRPTAQKPPQPPVYVDMTIVEKRATCGKYSMLYQFLCRYFNPDEVRRIFKLYLVGGIYDGWCAFPLINADGHCVDIHYQAYDKNGHRWKEGGQTWELARQKKSDRRAPWCLFGEHLINARPDAPIGIVESEKTALIASLYMPDYVWLATVGLVRLKAETCAAVMEREIYLFPDADGIQAWKEKAEKMKAEGFNNLIIAADFVMRYAERPKDDLADIILKQIENERR